MIPYNRRPLPPVYDKGFLDTEHIYIQQAIQDGQANYRPMRVARLQGNASASGGAFVTTLLNAPVAAGEAWFFRWLLFVGTSAGATGGTVLQVVYPAANSGRAIASGNRSGSVLVQTAHASPLSFPTGLANADYSASDSWITVEASFDLFTAPGTVDLQFKNVNGGETIFVRPSSLFQATRIFP